MQRRVVQELGASLVPGVENSSRSPPHDLQIGNPPVRVPRRRLESAE
jgi:hypothetical protein